MINKFFIFLFAVTLSAQSMAALDNPFNKTSRVNIGSNVPWHIKNGVAVKTSSISDKDGTFYQLKISQRKISLQLLSAAPDKVKRFNNLVFDDVQFDGKTSALFQWCLNNQQSHSRFLQQGLHVKKGICQIKGEQGLFVMKLNQATYTLLKSTQNITFTIKPYRSAAIVSFDMAGMHNVFARLDGAGKVAVSEKKPVSSKNPHKSVVAPAVKAAEKTDRLCVIKPPASFSYIKANKYICSSSAAKANARKKMAVNIKKARTQKAIFAKEREQKSRQSLTEKKSLDEEKRKEAEAVLVIEKNTNKLRDQVSNKMIAMCQKKWADGEHRCYCEPYLEFAPLGIKSDASCADR